MRKDLFEEMYQLEESYWWHVAKRHLVKTLAEEKMNSFKGKIYADIGCGTGMMLSEMKRWKRWKKVVGLDGSKEALKFCRQRGITEVKASDFESKLNLKDKSVDLITCLDVVEHVAKDKQLLGEFERVLKPKGVVVVTVPAYRWMWTYWDDILGHKRRYTREEMVKKMEQAGLVVEKASYFYSYLLPVAVFFRLLKTIVPRYKGASDFISLPQSINQILIRLAKWETKVAQKFDLPMGLSLVCVASKRG